MTYRAKVYWQNIEDGLCEDFDMDAENKGRAYLHAVMSLSELNMGGLEWDKDFGVTEQDKAKYIDLARTGQYEELAKHIQECMGFKFSVRKINPDKFRLCENHDGKFFRWNANEAIVLCSTCGNLWEKKRLTTDKCHCGAEIEVCP